MISGVLHFDIKPEKVDEFKKKWDPLVSEVRKEKGFINALLFTDTKTGKCLSIGLWDTREDALAFQGTALYQKFTSELKDLLKGTPYREVYEVSGDTSSFLKAPKAA